MKIEMIKAELICIWMDNSKSKIRLKRIDNNEIVDIVVDESSDRIFSRMQDVLCGERDFIYLSRCMTNININCTKDEWIINQEDGKYYKFSKEDIKELRY